MNTKPAGGPAHSQQGMGTVRAEPRGIPVLKDVQIQHGAQCAFRQGRDESRPR